MLNTHCRAKDHHRLKVREWKNDFMQTEMTRKWGS